MIVRVKPRDDDMAALVEAQPAAAGEAGAAQHLRHPRAGDVDEDAGSDFLRRAVRFAQRRAPQCTVAACGGEIAAGDDLRAVECRVAGIGDRQTGIVDDAVRIDKAVAHRVAQRRGQLGLPSVDTRSTRADRRERIARRRAGRRGNSPARSIQRGR